MDKKKLSAVRRLADKTGMLQLYAESVVDGRMSVAEAMERSFQEVQRREQAPGRAEPQPARRAVVLSFRLEPKDAETVLRALEICRRHLPSDASRDAALVELAKVAMENEEEAKT